jgi:hypothetical protein
VDQQSFQNDLDPLHANWTLETSGLGATSLQIDLFWPELYYTTSGGQENDQDAVIYMEYSPYSQNAWQPVPGYPAGTDADGNSYPAGSLWIKGNTHNPTRQTVAWDVPSGQYDIRVGRRIRRGGDTSRSVDDVYWTALRSYNSSEPAIADETLSLIVLRVMATQDFSGTLSTISGVVTPLAPIYNPTTGTWPGDPTTYDAVNWQPTSNAAALVRYMMTGYPAANPLTAAEIDASFGAQYTLIETMNWHGGQIVMTDTSQSDLMVQLGKLGRCYFYWNGQALCCVPDYEKPSPRQIFSGRNAQNYKYKRVFPDPVHAVFVQFINIDEDYQEDGFYVYNDGYTGANATLFESLTLQYACTADRAQREGRVFLAKLKLLVETHSWTAGIDAVASTFGDRVAVRHISTLFGIGEARVRFRRWSGALVAGVRLDGEVTFEAGQTYTVDVRRNDQVLRGVPIVTSAGTTRDLVFGTPLAQNEAPNPGDLLVIGLTGVVTEDVEIIDVQPQPDGSVQITAQKYDADAIVAAETGTIAALQSALTTQVAAPVPTILGATGDPSGITVAFAVVQQRQTPIAGFAARWRRSLAQDPSSTWNSMPTVAATARSCTTPPIINAQVSTGSTVPPYNIDVEIRTVLTTGEVSQPALALSIVVTKGVYPPTTFTAVGAVRTATDGSSYPVIAISCDPVTAGSQQDLVVELQPTGAAPPAWAASASGPFHSDNPAGDVTDVLGGNAYDIRVRWRTSDNWYSTYVTLTDIAVPSGLVSANTANVGDRSAGDITGQVDELIADQAMVTESQAAAAITLGDVSAQVASVQTDLDTAVAGLQSDIDSNAAAQISNSLSINNETSARVSAVDVLTSNFDGLDSSFTSFQESSSTAEASQAADIELLQSSVGDLQALTTEQAGTLVTLAGKVLAYLLFKASANGDAASVTIASDGVSTIKMICDVLSIANDLPNGVEVDVLTISNGYAKLASKLLIGASVEIDPSAGVYVVTVGTAALAFGPAFGANDDLVLWYGPATSLAAMSKTNGLIWFDTAGDAQLAGALAANTVSTSSLQANSTTASFELTDTTVRSLGARNSAAVLVGTLSCPLEGFKTRIDFSVGILNNSSNHDQNLTLTVYDGTTLIKTYQCRTAQNSAGITGGSPEERGTFFFYLGGTTATHTFNFYAQLNAGTDNETSTYLCNAAVTEYRDQPLS